MDKRVKCFWTEPTGFGAIHLRRYAIFDGVLESASRRVEDSALSVTCGDRGRTVAAPEWDPSDPRWPEVSDRGFKFKNDARSVVMCREYHRRPDTGEEWLRDELPPGAMYDAYWMPSLWRGADGVSLTVVLPDGKHWHIDGSSEDGGGWTREGPLITVTVRPSIVSGETYHGHLTSGWLEPCD